ncbi:uncharacterized protein [Haliotis asinina]|uniref:uncharacterized protein n=1 Tax=Haliotis asinina TaxID=109174 RepID=UPI003531DB79
MASVGNTEYYRISGIVLVFFFIYLRTCFVIAEELTFWTDHPDNYDTSHPVYNITTSESSWWTAALSGCSQFGGRLYIPRSQSFPDVLLPQMQLGVNYWIGAVKYPTWIWTAGQSTLYTHIGYMRISTYRPVSYLEGNCVLTCYQHCKERYTTIGLRGNECYCVENVSFAEQSDHFQVRCPGNYDEFCGDDNGVSLYKRENFITIPSPIDKCGYASESTAESRKLSSYSCYSYRSLYYVTIYLENNCDNGKGAAYEDTHLRDYFFRTCSRNICLSEQYNTFEKSKLKCNLVKVSRTNIENLCYAMEQDNSWNTYWVGLQRRSEQKWINGSDMGLHALDYYDDVLPLCLAVSRTYQGIQFHWTECSHRHTSICETMKVRTTKPPAGMSTHTTNTPSLPSSGPSSSPDIGYPTSIQATSTDHTERNATSIQQPSSNIGTYVGCSIAAAAVAVSLVVLIISYRRRLLCFKDKGSVPYRGHVNFHAGVDNATYTGAVAPSDDQGGINMSVSSNISPHYSVIPIATVTPNNHVHLTSSRQDAENHYNNIKPGKNTLSVTNSCSQEDDGHYVVPKASTSKKGGKYLMSTEPTARCHNTDQPLYDTPRSRSLDNVDGTRDDGDSIYHLPGDVEKDDNPHGTIQRQSRDTTGVKAPYLTLIQDITPLHTHPESGVYDQLIHPSQRHAYDTVSRDRRMKDTDNMYNHVGQANNDADDNYDTTRRLQQRRRLDDYSHTDDVNVVLENGDDDEVDDTYQFINDTGEEGTNRNVQPVYSNSGNSHPQVTDDADYYNLPLATDAGNNISEDPSRQQDDQVYSLAIAVSHA